MIKLLFRLASIGLFSAAFLFPFINQQHIEKVVAEQPQDNLISVDKPKLPTWLQDYPVAPDFATIEDVYQKKLSFFSYFYPLITAHNEWIVEARNFVEQYRNLLKDSRKVSSSSRTYLAALFSRYSIEYEQTDTKNQLLAKMNKLLKRMDVIPPELILIQAANESGWGTSRFAREGKNYFGQWCYQPGCGLVPINRVEGLSHEVEKFEHAYQALDSYFVNVNTNNAYRIFREMRASYRKLGQTPSAEVLATGLMSYSERGADYVQDIIAMLRSNQDVMDEAKKGMQAGTDEMTEHLPNSEPTPVEENLAS
ncbi:glucosaminidase domain-containing protein [Catenovulum sp. 2E275]|uniref:glucosaminidase domain-containing protein n=1 Tax=Catenovulum sp. 2E275 TaxID=2980497 RepID=UPI0021D16AC4|nr:glucosaminidase domain-containing protein [Catenovulum sp. 2E275]MCU4674617.1 glucosaminidase domain-containing protein [Catenovulum sp. 2E275]